MPPATPAPRQRFLWFVPAAIALVVLGDVLFFQHGFYGGQIGMYLAAILLVAVALRPAIWRDRRAWVAVAAALLFAGELVREPGPLAWLLFWAAAGIAVLLPATARFDDGWRWFQRLALQGLRAPLAPILDLLRVSKVRRRRPGSGVKLSRSMATLALPVVGSGVILLLFASANPVLDRAISDATDFDLSGLRFDRVSLWIALFVAAWALLHPRPNQRLFGTFDGTGDLPLPGVSVASVTMSLVAFNLLFALQNAMDLAYLGGLQAMPDGITLAEYAHRGAYPLIATALLAALFVLIVLRPGSTTAAPRMVRTLVVVWIAQNLILVASSIVRTIDYIEAYSLTELRIAALAWMALVAAGLVFTCWRMLRGRSAAWLINVNVAAAALALTAFTLTDTAAVAASWNVRHARDVGGNGAALDLCYLRQISSSALPALIELEARPDLGPVLRDRVRAVRGAMMDRLRREMGDGGWTWRGASHLATAEAMVARLPRQSPSKPDFRRCDGSIVSKAPATPPVSAPPEPPVAGAPALTRKAPR